MAENKTRVQVFTPGKGDALSVRNIPQTKEDRAEQVKGFRAQKEHEQKAKEERFETIRKRRSGKSSGGSGGNINVVVDTEKK